MKMLDPDYKLIVKRASRVAWHSISRRFWYKLLSVVVAVFIWSYAITSNPTLLRDKWLDVDVRITGQAALASRNLALLTDVSTVAPTARVRVSVPQQSYQSVTTQNVTAELDLSTIRSTGKQQVKLRPSSVLGTATIPQDTIEIEVDDLAERNLSVNVTLEGKQDGYWSIDRLIDPSRITIKGPSSIVRRVSSATMTIDVSKFTSPQYISEEPVFMDTAGEVVDYGLLTLSTKSVSVALDVYPQKLLPVSADTDEVLPGKLPVGYKIDGVDIQPAQIFVAASQELLDNMTSVQIQPVDVSGRTQQFSAKTSIIELSDVKNYSAKTVNVTVDITEEFRTRSFYGLKIHLSGLDTNKFQAKWSGAAVDVSATDLYSVMSALNKDDLRAYVDLSAIQKPGTYELPIYVSNDDNPEMSISPKPQTVTITITEVS